MECTAKKHRGRWLNNLRTNAFSGSRAYDLALPPPDLADLRACRGRTGGGLLEDDARDG